MSKQGYIYWSYGNPKYLKQVIASISTLRRFDIKRPITLYCSKQHLILIDLNNIEGHFDKVALLEDTHQEKDLFKLNLDSYAPYKENLWITSSVVWCKSPENLWTTCSLQPLTSLKNFSSEQCFKLTRLRRCFISFFKNATQDLLKNYDLTYLEHLNTSLVYSRDSKLLNKVIRTAHTVYDEEKNRLFSVQRALEISFSKEQIHTLADLDGFESIAVPYNESLITGSPEFEFVTYKLHSNLRVDRAHYIKNDYIRWSVLCLMRFLKKMVSHRIITPYILTVSNPLKNTSYQLFVEGEWKNTTEKNTV